jgi:replication factor C small subunit
MKKYKLRIPIGELYKFLGIDNNFYDAIQTVDRTVSILTPSGEFTPINAFVKKQGFVRTFNYEGGSITCDIHHKVKQEDGSFALISETNHVMVYSEKRKITSASARSYRDVYDISIDNPHEYITSAGVISHNTTLAKILANSIDSTLMYLNCSDENSVDTVREKIKTFASTMSFTRWKVAILDECDYLTPNAQAALRNLMETFSGHTRFILTCNYVEKIIDPIQSRCQTFGITPPSKKDVAVRVSDILTKEKVAFKIEDIAAIINANYPDIRRVLNSCQRQIVKGELKLDKKSLLEANYLDKLVELLVKKGDKKSLFTNIRQLIADSGVKDFTPLYKHLFDNLDLFSTGHIGQTILIIAESQYKDSMVVDKEINVMAMMVQLINEIA